MRTIDITPLQYAKLGILKGKTLQNVTKHLRAGNALPGVMKVKRFSRFYLLEVAHDFAEIGYKELIPIKKSKSAK